MDRAFSCELPGRKLLSFACNFLNSVFVTNGRILSSAKQGSSLFFSRDVCIYINYPKIFLMA